jgi:tetratricopeptide (TPR) repeat protein
MAADASRRPAAELRSGLEVLQEMLELQPGSMDLLRRKAAYARRLGEEGLLVESWLDLARTLRGRDGSRGARLLALRVLEMDPDNADARTMLRPVDRAATGAGDVAGESLAGALESGPDPEAAGSLRRRVAREFADEVGALRWLEAATEVSMATDGELPEDFFHYFGRYLMAHGRWEDAAGMLERVAGRGDALDAGEHPELVFSLALIYRRTGRHDRAVECFRRLAASEESFAIAWRSLPESGAV